MLIMAGYAENEDGAELTSLVWEEMGLYTTPGCCIFLPASHP
jgi:hypothetical protein